MDMNELAMMKRNDAQKKVLLEFYKLSYKSAVQHTLSINETGRNINKANL